MHPVYQSPIPTWLSKDVIEAFAEDVASALGYAAGRELDNLVYKTGGEIRFDNSGFDDLESGSIIAHNFNKYVIFLSANTSALRDRFTIAHELGHLTLHLPAIKKENPNAIMRATRFVDPEDRDQQRAEWEANWFAASFLMPREQFSRIYREKGDDFARKHFSVSAQAVSIRAKSLSLT